MRSRLQAEREKALVELMSDSVMLGPMHECRMRGWVEGIDRALRALEVDDE